MDTRFWKTAAIGLLGIVAVSVVAVVAYNAGVANAGPAPAHEATEAWRGYGHPFAGGWFFFPLFPLVFAFLFIFVIGGLFRAAWFGGPRRWHRGDLEDWHRRSHERGAPTSVQPENSEGRGEQ